MRVGFLATIAICLLPCLAPAHEGFLSPHVHHDHTHSHSFHSDEHTSVEMESDGKRHTLEPHADADVLRFSFTTGARYTEYDLADGDANLWEIGVGLEYNPTEWLRLFAEGRYGWFDSKAAREVGWLPARLGFEVHLPVAEHLEIGIGMVTQFPGVEPLGADEWELAPELEIRYDRQRWYVAVVAGVTWVLGGHEHNHSALGHTDEHAHTAHAHEEDEAEHAEHGEHHAEETHSGHADHLDVHSIIDQHGETEFGWQAALGVRLLDSSLVLEGRVSGAHVLQGDTPARNPLRAGARAIYEFNDHVAVILNASLPITTPRRNEWQTDLAIRLSF